MVSFIRFMLNNGLKVIVNHDDSTPLTAFNLLYNSGSRLEDPEMTGMAHLLEHLMFTGTEEVPEYDLPLQIAGGENNAFTGNDVTDYYITIPSDNIETAFWLESDRMRGLKLTQKSLDIQRNVVIEEFRQRYLNQPYGDAMLILRPLAYRIHPYRWPTIGMNVSHLENATLERVKDFYLSHYTPGNAILAISGNTPPELAHDLAVKWFGRIEEKDGAQIGIPQEPEQKEERIMSAERDVPSDALFMAWHICGRNSSDFRALDLITDILAGGESGRLYNRLVRKRNIFSEINTWLTSDTDPGLAILSGKLMKGKSFDQAVRAVEEVFDDLKNKKLPLKETNKVKNKYEASTLLSNTSALNKAMSLSIFELLGDAGMINSEVSLYREISRESIMDTAIKYFTTSNRSTLFYKSKQKT